MQRQDILPAEFSPLAGTVNYVVKRTHNEWSSSCPQCGGSMHRNGEFPDRFRMWVVSKYGSPLGWCRFCGFVWVPDNVKQPTKEEVEFWKQEQLRVERERQAEADRAIAHLQAEKIWEKFHNQNNEWSRSIFKEWGISESWIDYLKLGLIPDYTVKRGDEQYHSPAATIPIWNVGGIVQNVKLRVLNPKCGGDRYRNFYSAGQSFLFVPLYDLPLSGAGIIVEGEKKAVVLEQTLNDPKYRVVGIQSKTPSPEIFEQLKNLDPIYIWLDPDARCKENKSKESAVEYVTRLVGKERAVIVNCSVKVDDGIVQNHINPKQYLTMAKRA